MLGFEKLLASKLQDSTLSSKQYALALKPRQNISKARLDAHGTCKYIGHSEFAALSYSELTTTGVGAINITADMVLSMYEINTRKLAIYRLPEVTLSAMPFFEKFIRSIRRPVLEARIIGMQNDASPFQLIAFLDVLLSHKIPLVEVDLFGNETRHVYIDLKIGTSMNVLMENRLYRPGELANLPPRNKIAEPD